VPVSVSATDNQKVSKISLTLGRATSRFTAGVESVPEVST
jgi:hypothetical protein